MTLILLIAGIAGECLLGVALVRFLLHFDTTRGPGAAELAADPCAGRSWPEAIGLGILLGIGGCAWISFLYSLAGGPLGAPFAWVLTGLGWVAGVVTWMRRRRSPVRGASVQNHSEYADELALARCLMIAVIGVLLLAFVETLLTPQRFWDERAIFAIKGKVLYEDHSIDSPALRDPDFVQGHPRYPLLVPLAEQQVYAVLGRFDDRWSKIVFPLLFCGLVLSFAGVLGRHFGAARGWLYAGLLVTTPVLFPYELGFISGQGDAPVAAYHGAAVLFVWHALRMKRLRGEETWTPWLTAGCLAAGAAFCKDEGIAYLMIAAPALVLAWYAGRRSGSQDGATRPAEGADCFRLSSLIKNAGVMFGVSAALLAPWFWHRRTLPTTTEMNYFGRISLDLLVKNISALAWLAPHLLQRMFGEWAQWGLQWWIAAAALISAPGRALRPEQVFLLLDVLGALAALIIAGMIAPADLHEHIGGSSVRYLMQIAPTAVLFIAGEWGVARPTGASTAAGDAVR